MLTAIIGHTSRTEQIASLIELLPDAVPFVDDGSLGANRNHHRALEWAADQPVLVLEDDAVPTSLLLSGAQSWHAEYPDRLISLYLGTSRPPAWQNIATQMLAAADAIGVEFIELDQLIHGVCYIAPRPAEIAALMHPLSPADFAVGDAWRKLTGLPVMYATTSLADHADLPTVAHPHHDSSLAPRHARRLPE